MEFIKILLSIAFAVLPLLLLLLLQTNAVQTTHSENYEQSTETTSATTTATTPEITTATSAKSTYNINNTRKKQQQQQQQMRKHEQIIDNSIDFTVDPCDDFYQYACGEWKQQMHNELNVTDRNGDVDYDYDDDVDDPSSNFKYDRTSAMIDYLVDKEVLKYFRERNMIKNLNTTTTGTTTKTSKRTNTTKEPDFIIKVHRYYKSCIAMQEYEPIKYLEWLELNEHVKWPSLINTTNSEEYDYNDEHTNANQKKDEEEHIQEIDEIIMDDDDDVVTDATVDDAEDEDNDHTTTQEYNATWITTLAILRKYGLNSIFIEEIIYSTKTYPTKLLLGFNKPIKEGGFKSLKIDNLKTVLHYLNEPYTNESFKELWLTVTKFEWQLIKLNDIEDDLGTSMITLEDLPVLWLNNYMRVIFNQSTPLDLNMRVVMTNVPYFIALDELVKKYDDIFLNKYLKIRFLWYLYQQEPQEFLPLDCIQHIKRFLPLAFEWMYEQRHDDIKEEIPTIHEMYNNIRRQFNLTLYNNRNNFDSKILEHFVTKLESIQLKVGTFTDQNPEDFFYENRKFYNSLKLSSRHYYTNRLKMLKFNFNCIHFGLHNLATTSIYYDMNEYNTGLASAPYFNGRLNILHIPLSILQPPIYHKEFSEIYKFSTLGFILAQTLMYGFNLNGLVFDNQLKLSQQLKCLGNLDSTEVNDKIADVSGFRLVYHTFFHSNANNLISNRKIFFLNFAQSFCATHTSDDNMGRNYVNYALAQFNEFAKVFECPPDSHMNPHEKCYLWD